MRVAVVGAGGVGGYFGGRLARAGVDVTLLSRGAHLEALRARGLEVHSVLGDFAVDVRATDDPASVGPVDYVLVAVKAYDLDAVLRTFPDLLGGGSAVVSLQNGVCNEERIAAVVGPDRVIGGAAYIFAAIGEPGVIEHTGGPARLVLGAWPQGSSQHVTKLVSAFRKSGVAADESEDIRVVLWSKFAFICAQAGTTAAVRLPVGEVRSHAASRQLFRDLLTEVCAVAAAEHVTLSPDFVDATLRLVDDLDPNSFSSLHHDLVLGRRMELEELHGDVVRRAAARNVDVPATRAVYGVLQPWAERNRL